MSHDPARPSPSVLQQQWENRAASQDLQRCVQAVCDFINEFEATVHQRVAVLNEQLSRLETLVAALEDEAALSDQRNAQHLSHQIRNGEPDRFSALASSIDTAWAAKESSSSDDKFMLAWVPILNSYYHTKTLFHVEDVLRVVKVGLEIVLQSSSDAVAQVRWAVCISKFLRKYRNRLRLEIAWRPLYTLLRNLAFEQANYYQGAAVIEARKDAIITLISKARRFFPAGSATQIWAEFGPGLTAAGGTAPFESLGWLELLMPTHAVADRTEDWRGWLHTWIGLWNSMSHNRFWDTLWMSLVSRLIKHDVNGELSWHEHLDTIFTRVLWTFPVPVGSASATAPISRHAGVGGHVDPAAAKFERLAHLLEQYYHPSNGGQWTSHLSDFLKYFGQYFTKRCNQLTFQGKSSGSAPTPDNLVVATLLKLAETAQYSKDDRMMRSAYGVISNLAYIAPSEVLPMVCSQFNQALDALSSSHLLASAIHTLGLCVRPLLLFGLDALEEDNRDKRSSSVAPRAWSLPREDRAQLARQFLSDAMMATLPAIDANDPPKTSAAFVLYTNILSNVGALGVISEGPNSLPLDVESWLDGLMTRVLAVISNLDSSTDYTSHVDSSSSSSVHKHQDTFLLLGASLFRPMLELLFCRLPSELRATSIRRIGEFVLTTSLPTVSAEAGIMCSAAVMSDPVAAERFLVIPLISAIKYELSEASHHMSNMSKATLSWYMDLLQACIYPMGNHVCSICKQLQEVIDMGLRIAGATSINEAACRVLSAMCRTCTSFYPSDQYTACESHDDQCGPELWISTDSEDLQKPSWYMPSDSEQDLAAVLASKYLKGYAQTISELCNSDAFKASDRESRLRLRGYLLGIKGSLLGFGVNLPDFPHFDPDVREHIADGSSLALIGQMGTKLDFKDLRSGIAEALLQAHRVVDENDTDSLKVLLQVVVICLSSGTEEYEESLQGMRSWLTDCKSLTEPAYFHAKRRRPRWLILERCYLHGIWRASQAVYRPWITSTRCTVAATEIPLMYRSLLVTLLKFGISPFKMLRDRAIPCIERVFKRHECLASQAFPFLLRCLGTSQQPGELNSSPSSLLASTSAGVLIMEEIERLQGAKHQLLESKAQSDVLETASHEDQCSVAAAMGTCSILRGRSCWRLIGKDSMALAGFIRALLMSSVHTSPLPQSAINELFLILSVRFVHGEQRVQGKGAEALAELLRDVLEAAQQSESHWRYSIFANASLLFLLPLQTHAAPDISAHFLKSLVQDVLPLRHLAMGALAFQIISAPSSQSAWDSSWQSIISAEGFAELLLSCLAHNHINLTDGGSQSKRFGSFNREETAVKAICSALFPTFEWPLGQKRFPAFKSGLLIVHHMHGLGIVTRICKSEWCYAFREPLQLAIANQANVAEKAKVCAAAEVLSGLLASGAAFHCSDRQQSAWDAWILDTMASALENSPLELCDVWALAVRFAVRSVCMSGKQDELDKLLSLLSPPLNAELPTNTLVKRLTYVSHILQELYDLGIQGSESSVNLQKTVIGQLPYLLRIPTAAVRQEVADCLVLLGGAVMAAGTQPMPGMEMSSGGYNVHKEVADLLANLVRRFLDAIPAGGYVGAGNGASAESDANRQAHDAAERDSLLACLGSMTQFIVRGMRQGDLQRLSSTLLQAIPALFSIQELPDPELQSLSIEAKTACALLKYLRVPQTNIGDIVQRLSAARQSEQWHARAAALVYSQYFWFCQIYLLSAAETESVLQNVVEQLYDSKVEVRELASATLSGLLKGCTQEQFDRLKSQLLEQARKKKPSTAQRVAGISSVQDISFRHGIALGLKAYVVSTPYRIPTWLPEVLEGLAQMSSMPAPIQSTVSKTLADFWRTHEEVDLLKCKMYFADEQWEIVRGASSLTSYFV